MFNHKTISTKLFWIIVLSIFTLFLIAGLTLSIFTYFPKIMILALLIILVFLFKAEKKFFNDWFLFLSIIYLADTARGLIYFLISHYQLPVYCEYPIKLEKLLLGTVPSVWLQNLLLPDGNAGWLEKILTFFHGTHFIAFLIVGFFIWIKDKVQFNLYKFSFYTLLLIGLSLYALVPTAPPWMASEMFSLLPRLVHFNLELYTIYIPDLTAGFNTDPVAAMPSLHAAFPFLCSLILWKKLKFKALPFYLYTGTIIFTIIYSGDHYLVDILAGVIIAIISYKIGNTFLIKKRPGESWPDAFNWKRQKRLAAGLIIIFAGLITGQIIKPELKVYYSQYNHLKFPEFINHPEKSANNYSIAIYLGDFYAQRQQKETALKHYLDAQNLARNTYEKRTVKEKIRSLNLYNKSGLQQK